MTTPGLIWKFRIIARYETAYDYVGKQDLRPEYIIHNPFVNRIKILSYEGHIVEELYKIDHGGTSGHVSRYIPIIYVSWTWVIQHSLEQRPKIDLDFFKQIKITNTRGYMLDRFRQTKIICEEWLEELTDSGVIYLAYHPRRSIESVSM